MSAYADAANLVYKGFISVSSKRTSKPTWDTKGCHAAHTHLTLPRISMKCTQVSS